MPPGGEGTSGMRGRSVREDPGPAPSSSSHLPTATPSSRPWRHWEDSLAQDPTVKVVQDPVALKLGVTRILREHPEGPVWFRGFPDVTLAGNVWSTRARVASYFGVPVERLQDLLLQGMEHPEPPRVVSYLETSWTSGRAVDLRHLPVPWFFPGDAGPYLTAGVISAFWKGKRNLSFHRLLVQEATGGPARIVPRHLDRMLRESRQEGKELPVAMVLGGPLEFLLAAALSTDYETDELEIASALHRRRTGEPLPVVEFENGIRVPAASEMVFQGRVTREERSEGPFVDILGTYDPVRTQPVLSFDKLHAVPHPVLHAILPGGPEHFLLMGLPREPAILRAIRSAVPGVRAVRLTEGGAAWLHGVVAIEKRRAGDGKNAILAAFAGHASMKHVIVVDADIDIFNDAEVEWAVATRFQADRGLLVIPGATGSSLDPSATPDGITTKWGMDCTLPLQVDRAPFTREPLTRRGG